MKEEQGDFKSLNFKSLNLKSLYLKSLNFKIFPKPIGKQKEK